MNRPAISFCGTRLLAVLFLGLGLGCSASGSDSGFGSQGHGGNGSAGSGNAGNSGLAGNAGAYIPPTPEAGPEEPDAEVPINQCGSQCGPEELCDLQHLGYDDNCNGQVDEGCPCTSGTSHWCFKGDPASRGKGACKDGVEQCSELGSFGACVGGYHADAIDNCMNQGPSTGCHDLSVAPFTTVRLKDGTGSFGQGATGERFEVTCPDSIPAANCPQVQNASSPDATFTPLQSGQYNVMYWKDNGSGGQETCGFSIYVGATGLRVELNWDHQGEGTYVYGSGEENPGNLKGPDLDLHVHRPGSRAGWFMGALGFSGEDCFYANCTAGNFVMPMPTPGQPSWFSDTESPYNWTYRQPYDPNDPLYTCYNAPRGSGQEWRTFNRGCHNPRLDLDNIACDNTVTDPQNEAFCAPENINIDDPPAGLWTRVGVHYYGNCYRGDLHPTLTIYCAGAQVAQLGPQGYNAPVTLSQSMCSDGGAMGGNAFWLAADVLVVKGECGELSCIVQPIYGNATSKTPLITTAGDAQGNFGPNCPPAGEAGPGCY